ncbi:MAG: ornithine carbamoyltransferase [Anaerolineales bacterium]|nr:ornithine carbamoyltransferase [Anaerolineales bacterium]
MVRHFLNLTDYSADDIRRLLQLARQLKKVWSSGGNRPILKGKTLGMVFQKPSLRTRVSFEMGMRHLGGDALYISPNEVGLGRRESVADVSRVLSGYVDGIMARVFAHEQILELARHSRVPVINGLSDDVHPCQAMADMLTLMERFTEVRGRTVAFIGDGNNTAVSLMQICAKLGVDFAIASPDGYALPEKAVAAARKDAEAAGSRIRMVREPDQAALAADVLYTDAWVSMGQEEEAGKREKAFAGYQVNAALMKKAKPDAVVLHCLPAHRGKEITDDVMDGPQSLVFPEAENRLHAQKAILADLLAPGA